MSFRQLPRFVRKYVDLREIITDAIQRWAKDVKTDAYPNDQESYGLTKETVEELLPVLKRSIGTE